MTGLLVLMPGFALAGPPHSPAGSPGEQCLAAITAAERQARLPSGLLRSIALVESGQPDPATRRLLPWPWTINVAGTGYVFPSREEAVAAVQSFQASGIRSIDVGCAQVNLLHHPQAFPSLEIAFEVQANAEYAARFLRALHAATGSWPLAAAAYHSRTPELGYAYARKVMVVWPDAARHGPWPSPGDSRGTTAPAVDYSMYTPEFAEQLRRRDEDRAARGRADGSIYTPEFAERVRPGGERRPRDRAGRSVNTAEFAGRSRRGDEGRARNRADDSIYTPEFADRLRRMAQDRAERSQAADPAPAEPTASRRLARYAPR